MAGFGGLAGLAAVPGGYDEGAVSYWRRRNLEDTQAAQEAAGRGLQFLLQGNAAMPGAMPIQPPQMPAQPSLPVQPSSLPPGGPSPGGGRSPAAPPPFTGGTPAGPPQAGGMGPIAGPPQSVGPGSAPPLPGGPPPGFVNPGQVAGQPQNLTGPIIPPGGMGPQAMPGAMPVRPPVPSQPPMGQAPPGPTSGPAGNMGPGGPSAPMVPITDWRQAAAALAKANPGIKPDTFFRAMDQIMKTVVNPEVAAQYRMQTIDIRERMLQEREREFGVRESRLAGGVEIKAATAAEKKETAATEISEIVEGIKSGTQPPTVTGLYGKGAAVRAALAKDGFDLATAQREWQAAQRQTASLNGPQMTRFSVLAKTVDNTIGEVSKLAEQMQLKGIPLVNRVELFAYIQAQGDTPNSKLATRYLTAINTLKEEFASLAQGGYAPTGPAWELANQQINGNYSVGKLQASLEEIQNLIQYRMKAIESMGGAGGGRYNSAPPVAGGKAAGGKTAPAAPADTEGWTIEEIKPGGSGASPFEERSSAASPFEVAAVRQRKAVKPEGGRQEGAATAWTVGQGEKIKEALVDVARHPENIVGTGELGAPLLGMLKPKGFIGSAGLMLKETAKHDTGGYYGIKYAFDMRDAQGQPVGKMRLRKQKDSLIVEYVEGEGVGIDNIRDLLTQIKTRFPDAKTISGLRTKNFRTQVIDLDGGSK